MIKLFDKKPDHPMCDLAEAKRLLDELPQHDDQKLLDEITFWLDSVKNATDFSPELRMEIVMLLDERCQPLKSKLLHRYLSVPHLRDFQGLYLWKSIHAFVKVLADAYAVNIHEYQRSEKQSFDLKEQMPLACVRQLLAASEQMKLELMRYIEVEASVWQQLYVSYQFAETEQYTELMVLAYPGHVIHTNPQRELLRALVLYISSTGTLAADQIEVSYRIAGRLTSFFDLKKAMDGNCNYQFELSAHTPPHRLDSDLRATQNMRYFGAVRALPALKKIVEQSESDSLWQERRFGSEFTPAGKLTVLKHLMKYWSYELPHRHMERRGISAIIEVTHGFRVISQLVTHIDPGHLVEEDANASQKRSNVELADTPDIDYPTELWSVTDMSADGIGAILTGSLGAWIKIGDLCAIKPQNGQLWWVGMIRRLHSDTDKKVHVGIELLAKRPASVWLRVLGKGAERVSNWETSSGSFAYDYLPVIVLPDVHNSYLNANLLIESGRFVSDTIYQVMMGERSRNIKLTKLIAEGEDYEQVGLEWLMQGTVD